MAHTDFDMIVVGAGIVGMSTALWAQKEGLKTLICDPNPAGSGTESCSDDKGILKSYSLFVEHSRKPSI